MLKNMLLHETNAFTRTPSTYNRNHKFFTTSVVPNREKSSFQTKVVKFLEYTKNLSRIRTSKRIKEKNMER